MRQIPLMTILQITFYKVYLKSDDYYNPKIACKNYKPLNLYTVYCLYTIYIYREYIYRYTSISFPVNTSWFQLVTYKFGLVLSECFAQVRLFDSQGVPRWKSNSCVGHRRLSVLLLELIGNNQECTQANIHPLKYTQRH